MDVQKCEHYLFYLSAAYGKQNFSITVIDKEESDEQMDYSLLTQVGGFYKKGCQLDANAAGQD